MRIFTTAIALLLFSAASFAQQLAVAWEELTAPDFSTAVQQAQGVCLVPIGVLEKHGPHLPLGTDVFTAREISLRAAQQEYCIVFPFYYAGQIFEAKQQPGTVAYSAELLYRLLDETCREIARNGIKKIILVNGHGGNNAFLQYFCQTQLATPRDYIVYAITPPTDPETQKKIAAMRKSAFDEHAGEVETSTVLAIRPQLVKLQQANAESGQDLSRLSVKKEFPTVQTGIWWYAQFPNHYAGDAKDANSTMGEISLQARCQSLVKLIQAVKADQNALLLQDQFYTESQQPLKTKAKP